MYNIALISAYVQIKTIPIEDKQNALEIARANIGAWLPVPWDVRQFCKANRVIVYDEKNQIIAEHETTPEMVHPAFTDETSPDYLAPRNSTEELAYDYANFCYQRGYGCAQNLASQQLSWTGYSEQTASTAVTEMAALFNKRIAYNRKEHDHGKE